MPATPAANSLDRVEITTAYRDGRYVVTAEMLPAEGSVLPLHVFAYENTGKSQLGPYFGVCTFEELNRLQIWNGEPIKKFGNRFIRHRIAEIPVGKDSTVDGAIAHLQKSLKQLRDSILAANEASIIVTIE